MSSVEIIFGFYEASDTDVVTVCICFTIKL